MRKQLVSQMDTPKPQKEVCIGHSKHLHSSPSAPSNAQHPVWGHKSLPGQQAAAPLPQGRGEGSALLLTPQLGVGPMPGSLGILGSSPPERAEAQSNTLPRGSQHLASAQLRSGCMLSKSRLLLN